VTGWNSLNNPRRSFWFAVATPAILLVGVIISETLFVASSGRARPGREILTWVFLVPATLCFAASWFYALASLRGRNSQGWWLTGAVATNLLVALWLLVLNQLAGEL
jgi:hypothetical protein